MKQISRRDFLRGSAAGVAGAALTGICGVPVLASEDVGMVDNVTIVVPQASFDLSPFVYGNRVYAMFYWAIYGTLMVSPNLGASLDELVGRMAKSVTTVSDTVYDVEIYDYIVDSQGNEIKAEDVVFSYEQARDSGRYSYVSSYMESVTAIDDYTVEFTLTEAMPGATEAILNSVAIVNAEWYSNATEEEIGTSPACTGPYTVESVTSGTEFVLAVNENYWQTDASLRTIVDAQNTKKMTYTVIEEMSMVAIALENHEVDIAEIDSTVSNNFLDDDGNALDGYNVHVTVVPRFDVFEYNCSEDSLMSNQYLRQAVSYALDAEQIMIANGTLTGMGTVSHDFCNSAGAGYNYDWDEEDYYDYDIDKAKECLEQSGLGDNITLTLLQSTGVEEGIAVAAQAMLSAIGIDLKIVTAEQATSDTMYMDSTQWDIFTRMVSTSDYVTSGWAARFDNSIWGDQGTANWTQDDTLQDLLHTAMSTQDPEDIDAFHYYFTEMCYGYGLFTANKVLVSQDGIEAAMETYEGNPVYTSMTYTDDYVSAS
ncbi:MAG: ABC transporter substrate-binding protein [Lachnospiraceae bacterium]|nr:ABC transporter substrate-binding protein [Lachnospiraceae bacterium]